MKPHKIKTILLIVICLSSFSRIIAQNNTMYHLNKIPQANSINPAIQHEYKVFVGLPVFSSVQLGIINNGFAYNDLIHFGDGPYQDSLVIDLNNLASTISESNFLSLNPQINILSVGISNNDSYFSFNITERINSSFSYSRDFVNLLINGNGAFLGQTAKMGGLGLDLNYFREFGFGYSRKLNAKFTAGASIKLLYGKININTEKMEMDLYTDNDSYDLSLVSDMIFHSAGFPYSIEYKPDGTIDSLSFDDDSFTNFIFDTQNFGLGLDIGVIYQVNEQINVSASLVDLGYINWKTNAHQLNISGNLDFQGLDITDMITSIGSENDQDSTDFLTELSDSLSNMFDINISDASYISGIGPKVHIGGKYDLNEYIGFGLLSLTEFYKGNIYPSLTISANANLGRVLTAALSYSIMNRTFNNIGLGIGLKAGPFQLYFVNDNISSLFSPHKARAINFRFGLNLLFGYNEQK